VQEKANKVVKEELLASQAMSMRTRSSAILLSRFFFNK
jgi:hypothetical protein